MSLPLDHSPQQQSEAGFTGWWRNLTRAVVTVAQGMAVTLRLMLQTYQRKTYTETFEYPEHPVQVKPRYRGFHRFDLTTCIGCDRCAAACPVDCIYIEKQKAPVGKGFQVNSFVIDYTKCMFCALCVEPCPVDCIFMGSNYDLSCYTRDGCVVDFAKLPLEVAWGQTSLNPTVVAASKVLTEPVWLKGEPGIEQHPNAEIEPTPAQNPIAAAAQFQPLAAVVTAGKASSHSETSTTDPTAAPIE